MRTSYDQSSEFNGTWPSAQGTGRCRIGLSLSSPLSQRCPHVLTRNLNPPPTTTNTTIKYPPPRQGKKNACVAPFRIAVHCWNIFSLELRKMHSPCSYFAIVMMGEGGGGYLIVVLVVVGGGFRFLVKT